MPENPTYEAVDRAAAVYRAEQCDGVVAIGGGSVIDTAKLTAVLAGHPGQASDIVGKSERMTAATAPLIVIPTTAGTGSEASPDAGLHPDAHTVSSGITSSPRHAEGGHLRSRDHDIDAAAPDRRNRPRCAITLHRRFFVNDHFVRLPMRWLWMGSGGYFAILPVATEHGSRPRLLGMQMMIAAFEGGVAIGKGLGPAHAIAISCGDRGLHHGMLSAIGILASMPVMEKQLPERMQRDRRGDWI